jgi:hypothetical protein
MKKSWIHPTSYFVYFQKSMQYAMQFGFPWSLLNATAWLEWIRFNLKRALRIRTLGNYYSTFFVPAKLGRFDEQVWLADQQ